MTDASLRRSFIALHLTLGLVITFESVWTLIHAVTGGAGHGHLGLLAATEATAALLFLWPRMMRVGGIVLIVTFATALLAHALQGEFLASLLVYAAATLFVTVHGSAWGPRQRQAAA